MGTRCCKKGGKRKFESGFFFISAVRVITEIKFKFTLCLLIIPAQKITVSEVKLGIGCLGAAREIEDNKGECLLCLWIPFLLFELERLLECCCL